jgi:hypothetical protein
MITAFASGLGSLVWLGEFSDGSRVIWLRKRTTECMSTSE